MDRTNRLLLITLIVLLVVALAFPMALGGLMGMQAMQGQMTPGNMPGPPWGMGLVMGLGGVAVIAFWAALIVGVVLLVRMFSRPAGGTGHASSSITSGDPPTPVCGWRDHAGAIPADPARPRRRSPVPGGVPENLLNPPVTFAPSILVVESEERRPIKQMFEGQDFHVPHAIQ